MLTYSFAAPSGINFIVLMGHSYDNGRIDLMLRSPSNQWDIGHLYRSENGYSFILEKTTGVIRFGLIYGLEYGSLAESFLVAAQVIETRMNA